MTPDEQLERWIDRQLKHAVPAMLASVSPVHIVKRRPGFGQTVQPLKGSIVASPVLADWDPNPDYFFHWFRDSAIVIDALRLACELGHAGPECAQHCNDFVGFSLALRALDGRSLAADSAWRARCAPEFVKFLRSDLELQAVHGDAVVGDTRVNADATLDISSWGRPQYDGAPLRALALLRWISWRAADSLDRVALTSLLRSDLAYTKAHWRADCIDIWEEERGHHYYTLRVSAAALERGAGWLAEGGERELARVYQEEARAILGRLDGFWLETERYYRSRVLTSGVRSAKELDISVILAAIHADAWGTAHGVRDLRMHGTLARLEALFDAAYPINQQRPRGRAPAMGRYSGDVYFSGGAYFFSTLGAAEFCFRAARGSASAAEWLSKGDAFLETVRAFTPASGAMAEQFDQRTGAASSARELAWSYGAFISCIAARRAALTRG